MARPPPEGNSHVIFVQSSDQFGSILAVQVDTAPSFRDSSRWWRPRSEKHVLELVHRTQAMETSSSGQPADPRPASLSVMGVPDDKARSERTACKATDTSSSDDLEQNENAWNIKQQSEGRSSTDSATRTPPLTADTQVEFSGSRGSRNSADSVATCVNTNSGTSDDSSTRGKTETRLDAARGAMHHELSSSSSSDFQFFNVPGLDSDSADSASDGSQAEDSAEPAQNSLAAHLNGTCKPCRFHQLKEGGCRLGDSCRFCHLCSHEQARAERLRIKYEDRRTKRRQGLRRR
mmetsp:Transcript_72394/g.169624  ORF Transcript_72394/g.169624 Transcript_72394/m.169624 type:complete len:291 (-) Transcript_72394:117-989(-)